MKQRELAGNGIDQKWELEGVEAPHDLAVIAAPVRLAGSDRPLAVLIGETRQSGSLLHKFILLPQGTPLSGWTWTPHPLPASPTDQLGQNLKYTWMDACSSSKTVDLSLTLI